MTPLASRRAADSLARRLDAGTPVPGDAALALALQLRATGAALRGAVVPRPEFRAALRTRLVAVATVQAATTTTAAEPVAARHAAVSWRAASRAPRRSRGPLVAAGALASVVAVSGIAVAGSQSLPGEPFYGVKTATESLQLRLAGDDVATGNRHLELAATRLREVRALTLGRDAALQGSSGPSGSGRSEQALAMAGPVLAGSLDDRVRDTLAAMDASTRKGTGLLTGAFRETRRTEPLLTLARFAERQSAGLTALLPALPAGSQDRARDSLDLLTGVAEQADALLGTGACTAACDPSAAAPRLPGTAGSPASTALVPQACGCPSPGPALSAGPGTPLPVPPPGAESLAPGAPPPSSGPVPSDEPTPTPSPSPSPTREPLPLPLPPLPLPTVEPLPLPTVLPLPLPTSLDGVGDTVGGLEDVVDDVLAPVLP